jgi:hypothetical protein
MLKINSLEAKNGDLGDIPMDKKESRNRKSRPSKHSKNKRSSFKHHFG